MKKVILIIAVLTTTLTVKAQSSEKSTPTKSQVEYSFAWGLFKSKDYLKEKSGVFKFEKPKFVTSLPELDVDTTKYEQKSILWGAFQWTEKKKSIYPENASKK